MTRRKTRLLVSNLPYDTGAQELARLFGAMVDVHSVRLLGVVSHDRQAHVEVDAGDREMAEVEFDRLYFRSGKRIRVQAAE